MRMSERSRCHFFKQEFGKHICTGLGQTWTKTELTDSLGRHLERRTEYQRRICRLDYVHRPEGPLEREYTIVLCVQELERGAESVAKGVVLGEICSYTGVTLRSLRHLFWLAEFPIIQQRELNLQNYLASLPGWRPHRHWIKKIEALHNGSQLVHARIDWAEHSCNCSMMVTFKTPNSIRDRTYGRFRLRDWDPYLEVRR